MSLELTCSSCGTPFLTDRDGEVRIKGLVVVFKNNKFFSVCKSCKEENELPIEFSKKFEELKINKRRSKKEVIYINK